MADTIQTVRLAQTTASQSAPGSVSIRFAEAEEESL